MPGELALRSLEIHNFRGLRELRISRLGRVNLIVGKNNVGKTSVLEAIRLYATSPPSTAILDILKSRGELFGVSERADQHLSDKLLPIASLFSGRDSLASEPEGIIRIGPISSEGKTLTISCGLHIGMERIPRSSEQSEPGTSTIDGNGDFGLYFRVGNKGKFLSIEDARDFQRQDFVWKKSPRDWLGNGYEVVYVNSHGLDPETILGYWAKVAMSDREYELTRCLTLIDESIERVNLIPSVEDQSRLIPFVRRVGQPSPVYLGSLGDGANRLFGLSLGLLSAYSGILLVDEIENGLHYTIQLEIWRFVFRIATRFGVQVFATTHSSDCVRAFQEAASESDEEGVLIHLGRRGDAIVATEFDENGLETAVEMNLELRG